MYKTTAFNTTETDQYPIMDKSISEDSCSKAHNSAWMFALSVDFCDIYTLTYTVDLKACSHQN